MFPTEGSNRQPGHVPRLGIKPQSGSYIDAQPEPHRLSCFDHFISRIIYVVFCDWLVLSRFIYVVAHTNHHFIPFYGWVILPCLDIQFVYPFISSWTFVSTFSLLWMMLNIYKFLWMCFCFSQVLELLSHWVMAWATTRLFFKVAAPFQIPTPNTYFFDSRHSSGCWVSSPPTQFYRGLIDNIVKILKVYIVIWYSHVLLNDRHILRNVITWLHGCANTSVFTI